MKAIIIGGGIGGLTAAIALRKAGLDVEVHERATTIGEVGAGISLWPNAFKVLDKLGLGEELRSRRELMGSGALRAWHGTVLSRMRFDDFESLCKAPMIFIHRADLIDILNRAVPDGCVRLGAGLQSFEQNDSGVTATFSDGRTARGDILIAADGLRSRVRMSLFPDAKPRYAGYSCFRAISAFKHADVNDCWGETWGPGVRFGLAPMSRERVYWWAAWNSAEGEIHEASQRKTAAVGLAKGWHAPLPAIVDATPPEVILQNDIYDIEPLKTFSTGRVALLGDAAHAMQPNLGQGACQAIEDGFVLGKCFTETNDTAAAFAAYNRLRVAHTRDAIHESNRFGRIGQMTNPLLCWMRNLGVRWAPPSIGMRPLLRFAQCEW